MTGSTIDLSAETVERIAAAVVAHLADTNPHTDAPLIDAAEVARRHGVTRSWAYDHAGDLGALRLGNGTRARLRFDPATVAAYLDRGRPTATTAPSPLTRPDRSRPRAKRPATPLLPIRGQEAA